MLGVSRDFTILNVYYFCEKTVLLERESVARKTKERIIDGLYLAELRKSTNMNQRDFAELIGIPLPTLRYYEQNKRSLTAGKFREIKSLLGYHDDSAGALRVMIDYLRITFKDVQDLAFFTETYLLCSLSDFISEETRLMAYNHLWRRGDIWIFDYSDKVNTGNYQITVQLSGQGCRQMELLLKDNNISWTDLLQKMFFERSDMKVTRLDVAMDEMYRGSDHESEHFLLSDLISKVYKNEVVFDRLKKWNHIGGGGLNFDNETEIDEVSQGISIYFGSRQSNLFFNFYEKRYELAKKEKMTLYEALEIFGIWNRFELRFAHEKAQGAIEEFISGVDLAEIAKGVVNKEMQVYDGTNRWGAFLPDRKWQSLFGGVEPLKLTCKPEAYNIERTINWLLYQVSDSLRIISEADKVMQTEYLKIIIESGQLTDKGKKIVDQLAIFKDIGYSEDELLKVEVG